MTSPSENGLILPDTTNSKTTLIGQGMRWVGTPRRRHRRSRTFNRPGEAGWGRARRQGLFG